MKCILDYILNCPSPKWQLQSLILLNIWLFSMYFFQRLAFWFKDLWCSLTFLHARSLEKILLEDDHVWWNWNSILPLVVEGQWSVWPRAHPFHSLAFQVIIWCLFFPPAFSLLYSWSTIWLRVSHWSDLEKENWCTVPTTIGITAYAEFKQEHSPNLKVGVCFLSWWWAAGDSASVSGQV